MARPTQPPQTRRYASPSFGGRTAIIRALAARAAKRGDAAFYEDTPVSQPQARERPGRRSAKVYAAALRRRRMEGHRRFAHGCLYRGGDSLGYRQRYRGVPVVGHPCCPRLWNDQQRRDTGCPRPCLVRRLLPTCSRFRGPIPWLRAEQKRDNPRTRRARADSPGSQRRSSQAVRTNDILQKDRC